MRVDSLQRTIDQLSDELGRSVAVDGLDGQLIATSRHFGDEDASRIEVVLSRKSSASVIGYLQRLGLERMTERTRIPASEDFDFKARICYPIPVDGSTKYFLWLIEDDRDLPHDRIFEVCRQISQILVRRREKALLDTARVSDVLKTVLSSDQEWDPIELILDSEPKLYSRNIQFLTKYQPAPAFDCAELALHVAAAFKANRSIFGDPEIHQLIVFGSPTIAVTYPLPLPKTSAQSTNIISAVSAQFQAKSRAFDGVGVSELGIMTRARELFGQSLIGSFAAQHLLPAKGLVSWSHLGFFQQLLTNDVKLPATIEIAHLEKLLTTDSSGDSFATLNSYLRCAGDMTLTSADLHIHRTTLRYRLDQIAKKTGIDFTDGRFRTIAHLALLKHRLAEEPVHSLLDRLAHEQKGF